jgi:uncharacterized membrane protein YbhN (UPF0104 family)
VTQRDDEPHGRQPKPWWRTALRLLGPVLFVWFLCTVDLGHVHEAVRNVPLAHLGIAVALCLCVVLCKGLRWHLLIGRLGCTESLKSSIVIYGDGMLWGTLTPGRLGEFRKLVHLNKRHGVSWVRGAWLSMLDRVFDVVAIVVLFCVGVFWLDAETRALFHPRVFAGVLGLLVLVIALRRVWCVPLLRWGASGSSRVHRLAETGAKDCLAISLGRLGVLVLLSLASMTLYVCMIRALSWRLPFELTFPQIVLCVVTSMLAGIVPVSYFNLGSRELVLITLFKAFGLSRDNAFSLSLLFLACYVILMAVSAFFWRAARPLYGSEKAPRTQDDWSGPPTVKPLAEDTRE